MQIYKDLEALAYRVKGVLEYITTEEGCKTSLVLPMLTLLGYEVFNPKQVLPEFTADVGIKRGEKVDYAIMANGKPKMLIECKSVKDSLDGNAVSQLFRYYSTTEAKFAVLTNGLVYKFYTDIDIPNRMDLEPFFEFNLLGFTLEDAEFLNRFRKGSLVGEMKLLQRDSRKRRLLQIIKSEIKSVLAGSGYLAEKIKKDLETTKLCSASFKEITALISAVALEESISCLENNLTVESLQPRVLRVLENILGKPRMDNLVTKLTGSSVYLDTDLGVPFIRVFSNNLDLRFSLLGSASSISVRVLEDLALHADIITDAYKEAVTQPRD